MRYNKLVILNLKRTSFTLIFVSCYLIFLSCQNPFVPSKTDVSEAGMGTLSLSIGGQDAGRTIMPTTAFNDFAMFKLDFTTKTTANTSFSLNWENNSGTIELDIGTWDLTITAYLKAGEGELLEAAKGELKNISINSINVASINVPLYPISTGSGTFSWNIDYPENVTSASMKITRLDSVQYNQTFYFIGGSNIIGKNDSLILDAGEYRVVIKLTNGEEEALLSEILHVYKNMESSFTQSFTYSHFPVSLLKVILSAWDNNLEEWNFTSAGITIEHFSYWGINGITDNNFNDITRWFNTICSSAVLPQNLNDFKALVDISFVCIAAEDTDFLDAGNYANQVITEVAINKLASNSSLFVFEWEPNYKTVNVKAGNYEVVIVFSDNLTYMPPTPGLSFSLINNGTAYLVSRGTATATEIIIPAIYEGKPVTTIANNGFSNYTNMISIMIPSSVTSIGDGAFRGCSSLTSITIPSGVTSIGDWAFEGCSSLTSITIPDNVTSIGAGVFYGCSSLTSITIPDSVTSIGDYAFYGCSGLTSVTLGTITEENFGTGTFPGNLHTVYFADGGGAGTFVTTNPGINAVWVKE